MIFISSLAYSEKEPFMNAGVNGDCFLHYDITFARENKALASY